MQVPTKIWDGFVRGYHWLQVACVAGLWYTGTEGLMDWHFSVAYLLLALLLTRLVWGIIGSDTAKFRHFIRSPRAVIQYLSSLRKASEQKNTHVGHNPAGGYMVVMFFLIISIQITTGLFATDDIISEGPFAIYVSGDTSSFLTEIHALNFDFMLAAIALHLIAIFVYLMKKDNLVKPMISGQKTTPISTEPQPKIVNGLLGWTLFLGIGAAVYFYFAKDVVAFLF
ncbi:cytochrome b/b6 domain-containing protein [Vibrio sp. Of7-15]|uniref:cytochrome b/b6 domain-containing protein n=1 Tax=Vibrio sp. Of7-15 TaxID=2724879 RepID=UPI001EF1DE6D|nr:cytochrome b/b6 domain-containing protein [Vibrio sp. Of7-15]MCG7496182.1 cytochrome b/b6 domain-containing protein [Vibrio sp. Of7-15]